jgi:tRNA-dihydrouridine synthase B
LLPIFAKHSLDLLTVHGRTVAGMYHSEVDYGRISQAVAAMPCPVLANGNVSSAGKAEEVLRLTGSRGLMIGRGAIRNPWIFQQIRQQRSGVPVIQPCGRDLLNYVKALYESVDSAAMREPARVQNMKKFMNFIGLWVEPEGKFLHEIRRVKTEAEFFRICEAYLSHDEPLVL